MTQKDKIIIFFSQDVFSSMMLNALVPELIQKGIETVLIATDITSSKRLKSTEFQDNEFLETRLLTDIVYPFIEENPQPDAANMSIRQLADTYGLAYRWEPYVNSESFLQQLHDMPAVKGALSIRNRAIFKKPVIDFFKQAGFLWNLHGGDLPSYRGVYTPFYAIENGEKTNIWTLHEVDEGIDTGDIVTKTATEIIPGEPVMDLWERMTTLVISSITSHVQKALTSDKPSTISQKTLGEGGYCHYPTDDDFKRWRSLGIVFADVAKIPDFYADKYTAGNTGARTTLRNQVIQALAEYYTGLEDCEAFDTKNSPIYYNPHHG